MLEIIQHDRTELIVRQQTNKFHIYSEPGSDYGAIAADPPGTTTMESEMMSCP
jgi:hypothetical protein